MSKPELLEVYHKRAEITSDEFHELSKLWPFYQTNQWDKLTEISEKQHTKYPFLAPAIQAQIQRIPQNNNPGKPIQTLLQIFNDLNTKEFEPVFREFCKKEPVYGFGDTQVKRLIDQLNNQN